MTAETPDEALNRLAADLGNSLHQVAALLGPLWDAADGVRNVLERKGWSPAVAEELAAEYLRLCMKKLFSSLDN
ncbi:hypothetical protein [Streptomyces griseoaurantiacus]|uniref:Uncharacterized protein n=1 Tax=Streptomyces griseoaurantiacus TaxID=68213 RepID=A0A7W2HUK1_9ACTN|nr:hypothetical protein [Streptomyces griseoaurantiacus]MBA5222235.1 hypothetical protein [Streptomyces griseoaurantiacus]